VPDSPTPEQVAAELRGTLGALYRRIKQTRVEGDLTLPESSALSRLQHAGPMTGARLAKLEQISPQSIGATVTALETKGLITRSPDLEDGRRVILSLTSAGEHTIAAKRSARTEQMTRAVATLSTEERAQLLAVVPLLERLTEEL
jgi:DNA-binding MarR family transcriptional regulator